ncbi:uncharacterized protein LOC129581501 [Paramacrobiotus metropolitanus]|uniref:uncharacterized protein LOC129581501 n=1 Tax=Paramacrobiotus metropolitanus TaxID=2943436 RepID=UPI00244635D9|nr:uncharacterized protein LOC129581501 [Paramacrobiotus metropolitanus]
MSSGPNVADEVSRDEILCDNLVAASFEKAVKNTVQNNDEPQWQKVLFFPTQVVSVPENPNCARKASLATTIKQAVADYESAPACLDEFDDLVRVALETITNTRLHGPVLLQASFHVARGGLGFGVRRTKALATSAFLAYVFSTRTLTAGIFESCSDEAIEAAVDLWKRQADCTDTPPEPARVHHCVWDHAVLENDTKKMWAATGTDDRNKARLNAISSKYAGAWLNALPSNVFGNWLDDQPFRISIGLWLGAKVVEQHRCNNCAA